MVYYVGTRNGQVVAIFLESPYLMNLPVDIAISKLDGTIPDLNYSTWDGNTNTLVESRPSLTRLDFITRFTAPEWDALISSADANIKQGHAMLLAAEFVDINDPRTMMLVGYCAMIGIIANARVAEILA